MKTEMTNKIIEILQRYASVSLSTNSALSTADLSPIDTIMVFLETEQTFQIEIPHMEEIDFITVQDYINFVDNLVATSKNNRKLN